MEKDSALYQLMDTRMNGVMNSIASSDGEYQSILRKSDEYSGKLERMGLPMDVQQLINRYVLHKRFKHLILRIPTTSSRSN